MSETQDIGAARVRLIVDAADFDPVIEQGKRAITGFGNTAQQAYDRTEKGTRRAADALLDYVNSLGRADTTMDKYIRTASRMGVEKPILDAAIEAWARHNAKVEDAAEVQADNEAAIKRAAAAYKLLVTEQAAYLAQEKQAANADAATRIENLAKARDAAAQQANNRLFGINDTNAPDLNRRAQQEELFVHVLDLEDQAQADLAEHVKATQLAYKQLTAEQAAFEQQQAIIATNAARERVENLAKAREAQSQIDINRLVAPGLSPTGANTAQQQATYEALFGQRVTETNQQLEQQLSIQEALDAARNEINDATKQQDWNRLLGIKEHATAYELTEKQAAATSAFLPMLEEQAKLEQENTALVNKQQAFLSQLENIQKTAGKSYYEMLQLRAAEAGVAEQAGPLIAAIKAQNEATGAGTLSAKQYEFALRGLPAQFTDIVVSLQGGQRPLTVLLQQGGQIKDMFGGVGNAVKVVASEILKLAKNPLIYIAATVAGLAAAAFEASQNLTDVAIATAKGNQVAGSAKNLVSLTESLTKLDSFTSFGKATAAVQALAAQGKLTGDNFAEAAQAAARWASITGDGADDIINKFGELARDPMQAVLDGTLRVTDAQYAQLVSLDRTGQKAKEVALAIKLYQDQINDNSDSVLKNLSDGEKGWLKLKAAISDATQSLGEFTKEFLGSAFNRLRAPSLHDLAAAGTGGEGMIDLLNQFDSNNQPKTNNTELDDARERAAMAARTATALRDNTVRLTPLEIEANDKLQKSYDELGTKTQRYNTELTKLVSTLREASPQKLKDLGITAVGDSFSGAGFDKLKEGLRLKIFGQNEGGDPTKPIKEWEKTVLDAYKTVQEADDALYKDHLLTIDQYFDVSEKITKDETATQLESIDKQIKSLKGRDNAQSQIAALNQQRFTVEQAQIKTLSQLEDKRAEALKQQRIEYENYVQALADANIQLDKQGSQAARGVGLGSREQALQDQKDNATSAAEIRIRNLQQQSANGLIDPAEALKKEEAEAAALSTQLTILQGNYDKLTTAQADWSKGATKAWQDWSDQVSNVAAQVGQTVTSVLNDLTDMFVQLAQTGHLSFSMLIGDITSQIEKAGFQYLLQQAFGGLLGLPTTPGAAAARTGGAGGAAGISGALSQASLLATLIGSAGTSSVAASGASGLFSLFSGSFGGGFFAKGGAFAAGTGLASHRNRVVTSPTIFPFARGGVPNWGVMGEKAGSPGEAIMPLTRTPSGDLGVKVQGNNQAPRQQTINQTFVVPGATTRYTQDQIANKTYGAAARAGRRS